MKSVKPSKIYIFQNHKTIKNSLNKGRNKKAWKSTTVKKSKKKSLQYLHSKKKYFLHNGPQMARDISSIKSDIKKHPKSSKKNFENNFTKCTFKLFSPKFFSEFLHIIL